MGLLKYTKSHSASDDGSLLTGAELGQLETDISSVLNGGVSNVNIAADAAVVESKLEFDTTSGHNHDGSNSRALGAGGQRGFIQGGWLEYVAIDQVKAQSGTIEIAGSFYTRTSYSTTIDTDTAGHWVEGASQRGTDTWAYVYAYNDSGSSWDIKYWLQKPQYANTGTDDSSVKIYRSSGGVWYRCLGAVRMDNTGSGNILEFYQIGNFILHERQFIAFTSAAFTDIDLSDYVPAISTLVDIGINENGQSPVTVRPNGAGFSSGPLYSNIASNFILRPPMATDVNQIIEAKNAGGGASHIYISGYWLNIR